MRFPPSTSTLTAIVLSAITAACGGGANNTDSSTPSGASGSPGAGAGGSGAAGAGSAGTTAKGGAAGTGAASSTGKGGTGVAGNTGTGGSDPGTGGSGAAGADPGTGGADPGTGGSDPGTGGTGGDPGTAGAGGDAGGPPFAPAAHPGYPPIENGGGPVLGSVQLITISFAGWTGQDHAQALGDAIVQSEWLATVGADYGVGKGNHLAKVVLNETAPTTIDDSEIPSFLGQRINNGTLPKPPNKNDYLYMLYFPPTTIVTLGGGTGKGCAQQGFGGYHSAAQSGSTRVAYGVIPGCQSALGIETSMSHELIEAATDPVPFPGLQAYRFTNGELWSGPAGGEVGDVCNSLPWKEGGFTYQRSWSKSAAAAGKEPCVPTTPGLASFSVAPSPAGLITATAGQAITVTLTGWSDAPMGNWHLTAQQFLGDWVAGVKFSSLLINNGYTSDMTITVPATAAKGSNGSLFVESTYMGEGHYWPINIHVK